MQKYACVEGTGLFYSRATLVFLLCIKSTINKIASHNPQKTFIFW